MLLRKWMDYFLFQYSNHYLNLYNIKLVFPPNFNQSQLKRKMIHLVLKLLPKNCLSKSILKQLRNKQGYGRVDTQLPFLPATNIALNKSFNNHNSSPLLKLRYEFMSISTPFQSDRARANVLEFLQANQIEHRAQSNSYRIKICPLCTKPHHNDPSNHFTLSVNKEHGAFMCFRCSSKGSWLSLRERFLGLSSDVFEHLDNGGIEDKYEPKISDAEYFIYRSNLEKEEFKDVVEYLQSRGFKPETLKKYNVGAGYEEFFGNDGHITKVKCIYFPAYKIKKEKKSIGLLDMKDSQTSNYFYNNAWSEIVKVKIRGNGKINKKYMKQSPAGGQRGFFGLNMVKDTDDTIVLTEGEFDAMAVYQKTGIPSLSLPQGATNLSESLLPYLKKFSKIILWMDNDEAGLLNISKMVDKLGINRTYVVKHSYENLKDANDFLTQKPQLISQLLSKAKTIPDGSLISFDAIREDILNRISKTEQNFGVKVSWLPFFNKVVKGIRMGELTIMSGPTGSGKTTFLSQLTIDLCKKDISVLWGSFEIRNQILITSMLYQFSDLKLDKHLERYDYFADGFSKLPLHFMNFHGSQNIDRILSIIIYSIEKNNVHVVVLDTLQFMLSEQAEGFKKFQLQDTLMARLRDISIKYNVHVMIVIHPKKTEDNEDLGIHSIYGTSKATQEADNVWFIQNRESFKVFDVKKNRYDGELGRIPLGFNRGTKNFFQLSKEQFQALRTKQKTMGDIVKYRQQTKIIEKQEAQKEYDQIFTESISDSSLNRVKQISLKFQNNQQYQPQSPKSQPQQ